MEHISYNLTDTIYALASGLGKAGVAVIRVSGSKVLSVLKTMAHLENPKPRYAYFKPLYNGDKEIDQALVLYFQGPNSFTGEDVVELQVHGGRAVIQEVMLALGNISGCRPAERGEFSRRAVINGKMDLTGAEGLLDLIHAETERQRVQALSQMQGRFLPTYKTLARCSPSSQNTPQQECWHESADTPPTYRSRDKTDRGNCG